MKHEDTKQFWAWVRIIRQDLPSIVIQWGLFFRQLPHGRVGGLLRRDPVVRAAGGRRFRLHEEKSAVPCACTAGRRCIEHLARFAHPLDRPARERRQCVATVGVACDGGGIGV